MKRFRFSLQPILAVREARVDQAESDLAKRERSCRELRERLARLRDTGMETLAELAMGQESAQSDPLSVRARHAYLRSIKEQITALEAKLITEHAEVVRLRQVLLERSKEEKIIEHLKKRKIKAFRGEMARERQAEIDGVATERWASRAFRGFGS